MNRAIRTALLIYGCLPMVSAQPAQGPVFDAASVRPSPPPGRFAPQRVNGGPGTADPTRISYRNTPMRTILFLAYGVDPADTLGPAWATTIVDYTRITDGFDIEATLPAGTSPGRFRLMLQNLLAERFALSVHREKKEAPAFALVPAKNGPKLKESLAVLPGTETGDPVKSSVRGEDDFPLTPPGYSGMFVNVKSGRTRVKFLGTSMEEFAKWTRVNSKRPGIDRTGLTGRYDFYLEFSNGIGEPGDQAEDFSTALQTQLELKLLPEKTEVELLVIDHIDRTPSGN
jgi:uncharacterized protein (TIGR03435 family)